MKIIERNVARRTVIEAYVHYDCLKKQLQVPNFDEWDWSNADVIDERLDLAHLKVGIPAGYIQHWEKTTITMADLRGCAVDGGIFPQHPRPLGLIESAGGLGAWRPDRKANWYEPIVSGQTLGETAPLILRPAVACERPASWYIEDGSGRAIAFVANQLRFDAHAVLAIGYLGREPDRHSSFMQRHFRELL
jgi:hypothetical protein